MNRRALGSVLFSGLIALAGVTALGAGGYMTITGKSICSVIHAGGGGSGCGGSGTAVTPASAKEGGEKKDCCPLGKAKAVAAKSGACSGEGKVAEASSDCSKKCSGGKVASSRRGFYMMGGGAPVAMPAMFYDNKAGFCTTNLKDASSCDQPCPGEGKGEPAAHEGSGCSSKEAEKAAEAQNSGKPVASRE